MMSEMLFGGLKMATPVAMFLWLSKESKVQMLIFNKLDHRLIDFISGGGGGGGDIF